MTQESLRELLARVHERLSASGASVDAESRRLLGTLTRDIERALGAGAADAAAAGAAQAAPRLESLAVRFQARHPGLAEALRELIDALGKAGI
jgi:hypothetical protein